MPVQRRLHQTDEGGGYADQEVAAGEGWGRGFGAEVPIGGINLHELPGEHSAWRAPTLSGD